MEWTHERTADCESSGRVGGHVHMMSSKFSDVLPPLSLSHSHYLSVLLSAFWVRPSERYVPPNGRHMFMPP